MFGCTVVCGNDVFSINENLTCLGARLSEVDKALVEMEQTVGLPSWVKKAEEVSRLSQLKKRNELTEEEYNSVLNLTMEKRGIRRQIREMEQERDGAIPNLFGKFCLPEMCQVMVESAVRNVFEYFIMQTQIFKTAMKLIDSKKKTDQTLLKNMFGEFEGLSDYVNDALCDESRVYKLDYGWLFNDKHESHITFLECCDVLNLDQEKYRNTIGKAKNSPYEELVQMHRRCSGCFLFEGQNRRMIEQDLLEEEVVETVLPAEILEFQKMIAEEEIEEEKNEEPAG